MTANGHDQEHVESVSLYALRALPAREAAVVEARLAACADCRQELERLRPIVDSFVSWPTDVLRPSTSLWDRLAERIASETGGAPRPRPVERRPEPDWVEAAPGISCKVLATDSETQRVSMLVRLAPGTDYPPHRHAGIEELYLLQGELMVNEKRIHPGEYLRSEAGTTDHRVWSEDGCTCVLITSIHDALL